MSRSFEHNGNSFPHWPVLTRSIGRLSMLTGHFGNPSFPILCKWFTRLNPSDLTGVAIYIIADIKKKDINESELKRKSVT